MIYANPFINHNTIFEAILSALAESKAHFCFDSAQQGLSGQIVEIVIVC
jgi:hypothetical protein